MAKGHEVQVVEMLQSSRSSTSRPPAFILVVDDDTEVREGLCDALGDEGYRVAEAINGADAVRQIAEEGPDLILMDLRMPVMDGYTFLDRRRSDAALHGIPVIIVSSALDRDLDGPGVQVLQKPVELDELFPLVRRQLRWRPAS